jgi:hypothetical protein
MRVSIGKDMRNRQVQRDRDWGQKTWTINVCPVCGAMCPRHAEPCLSDDPPSLRPMHIKYQVVSEAWRKAALSADPFAWLDETRRQEAE